MFGGYQNEKIVLVAETQEELANNKFIKFDKIEELAEPYELYNGEYITSAEAITRRAEDEKTAQIESIKNELSMLDLKAIRALRAITSGTCQDKDTEMLAEIEAAAEELRQQLQALDDGE